MAYITNAYPVKDDYGTVVRHLATSPNPPEKLISVYLENGGSNDMAVDGTTPVTFSYTAPSNASIGRMI